MPSVPKNNECDSNSKIDFFPVENPKLLLPILKERHPQSCFIYNQAVFSDKFKEELHFYSLTREINSETWIVADYIREDYGHNIAISAPNSIIRDKKPVPAAIRELFSSGSLINWDQGIMFAGLEKPVSAMITDISANIKGNVTEIHPCILYYMDIEDALNISVSPGPEAELRRLDPEQGTEFILNTWSFRKEGSGKVIPKCITANASAGVFVDGTCASGIVIPGNGIMSALYTLKEFRKRGYAQLTMKYAMKEYAKDGCIPCSTAEIRNERAVAFHKTLGVKAASIVDWTDVKKLVVD